MEWRILRQGDERPVNFDDRANRMSILPLAWAGWENRASLGEREKDYLYDSKLVSRWRVHGLGLRE